MARTVPDPDFDHGVDSARLAGEAAAPGPKYPDIEVELSGQDGNAFAILGRVSKALRRGGATPAEVAEFQAEATSGDYDNVLATAFRWVEVS